MPIPVVCPSCSAKLNAPDTTAGKKVRCPKAGCGTVIVVPAPNAPQFELVDENPQPPKAATKKTVKVTIEDERAPRKKAQTKIDDDAENERPRGKRRRHEEEDDDDDRPTRTRRRVDDEDDDDEQDRPRKKKKQKKAAGIPPIAIAGIVLAGLLVLGGVAYGVYALAFKDSNTAKVNLAGGDKSKSSGSGEGSNSTARASLPRPSLPKGWVDFNKSGIGFKAYFPTNPRELNAVGAKIYEGEDKSNDFGCSVITQVTLKTILPEKRKEAGEELAKTFFDFIGAKILSRKDATLGGFPGTEFLLAEPEKAASKQKKEGEKNPGRGIFRVIVTETTLIMAGATSDSGMPKTEWVNIFFDSFELTR